MRDQLITSQNGQNNHLLLMLCEQLKNCCEVIDEDGKETTTIVEVCLAYMPLAVINQALTRMERGVREPQCLFAEVAEIAKERRILCPDLLDIWLDARWPTISFERARGGTVPPLPLPIRPRCLGE